MVYDFTEGSIEKKLVFFALPIVAGMMMHTAYNIIDTIFIGMLGPEELAAVSLAFPIVFVFIALASGLGVGANALIAQAIGKKDIEGANNLAEHGLILGTGMGIITAILAIYFSEPVFILMGADQTVLPLAMEYATLIFVGLIFMFAWFISDSILKSQGNSKTPMKNLAISIVLNIVLDPILIFGFGPIPAMGLSGAAIATVFSRIVALLLNMRYIYTGKSAISLSLKCFRPHPSYIKQMIVVGLPASASQTLSAAGFMLLMGLVGGFGTFAIAAYGVGVRLNSIAIMPMVGFTSAITSVVGQNVGAGKWERAKRSTLVGAGISMVISIIIMVVFMAFPEQIMRIFTQNPEIIGIGTGFLMVVPFIFPLYGFYFVLSGAFRGAGKTELVLATNIIYWIITLGTAYYLSSFMGLAGVWIAFFAGAIVELVLVVAIFYSGIWIPKKGINGNQN